MSGATIRVDGSTVRIIPDAATSLDVPRRQGFAWSKDARAYAERLSSERGWPIEDRRG